ncbi:MAG: flagellar biosynthesis anti-sigma factor FlgM [Desulfobulbaceae bacterium]|nr:flagellar biosynthesis anti-sigma factor FlgM [Desulfobulbaceae bacterium]
MTEKIGFDKGLGPIVGLSGPRKAANAKPGSDKTPADRVDFSTVLQEVSKTRGTQETSDTARTQKVAELREQIAKGTYRPDLEKVAASLINFMGGEE